MEQKQDIDNEIGRLRQRLRLMSALAFATNLALAALGLALLLVLLGRLLEWPALMAWALLPLVLAIPAIVARWWLRSPSRLDAAITADERLGLKARLSTMVYLQDQGRAGAVEQAQQADTQTHVRNAPWNTLVPIRPTERMRYLVLPVVAILAVLLYPETQPEDGVVRLKPVDAEGTGGAAGALDVPRGEARNPDRQQTAPRSEQPEDRRQLDDPHRPQTTRELLDQTRQALAAMREARKARQQARQGTKAHTAQQQTGDSNAQEDSPAQDANVSGADYVLTAGEAVLELEGRYPEYRDVLRRYFGSDPILDTER
jgi:hypothetical protein